MESSEIEEIAVAGGRSDADSSHCGGINLPAYPLTINKAESIQPVTHVLHSVDEHHVPGSADAADGGA